MLGLRIDLVLQTELPSADSRSRSRRGEGVMNDFDPRTELDEIIVPPILAMSL